MAKTVKRAKAPSRNKNNLNEARCEYNHYYACYPAIMGLLDRGDRVSDIAAHLSVDPGFIAAIADGTIRIRDLEAQDMSRYPALLCSRSADVGSAVDRLDAALRALDADDTAATVHHLVALRDLLETYRRYWMQ